MELTSGGETLGKVKINRDIFQGDSLSPILFVKTLIPLSILLGDMKAGYMLGRFRRKINCSLFIDDLKCERYRNFTQFSGVEILRRGTISA